MVSVNHCPACGSSQLNSLYTCIDHLVSNESFEIKSCAKCSLGITTPRPDDLALSKYYLSDDYISHSGRSKGIVDSLYLLARNFTLRWKCGLVIRHTKKTGSILDFGCGTGEFLFHMKKKNWQITGVEPSETGRKKAEEITGQSIYKESKELINQKADAITLWHVLEHIPDLHATLTSLHGFLQKDGVLIIAVPNYLSADANHYKEHWAGFDVPRHLWHFSKESMNHILKQTGFKLDAIVPMKLDAYYVSLLSEKNKKVSFVKQFFNACLQGVASNLKGAKRKNHSSLIYIARPL